MKIVSLVFNYDLEKQRDSGRLWGKQGYRNKDYIFEYSAASISTFLHHNPTRHYVVNTDDVDLLHSKISRYNVPTSNLEIVDTNERLEEWKQHKYCFNPAMMHFKEHLVEGEKIIKLDNDLTCLKPIDEVEDFDGALIWETEFPISRGREYWGERHVAREVVGTEDFNSYNIGVFGLSPQYLHLVDRMIDIAYKMLDVDISKIVYFKEDPAFKAKMWSCSEQTAYSYVLDAEKVPVREMNDFFKHHCYGFEAKDNCIAEAAWLKK
jgi:hypothetical protein